PALFFGKLSATPVGFQTVLLTLAHPTNPSIRKIMVHTTSHLYNSSNNSRSNLPISRAFLENCAKKSDNK
ncbi:MAG TPA: hypothetical protein VGL77_14450, partial [Armatimonadota bacterium]